MARLLERDKRLGSAKLNTLNISRLKQVIYAGDQTGFSGISRPDESYDTRSLSRITRDAPSNVSFTPA